MNGKSTPRIKYFLNAFFVVLFIYYTCKLVIAELIVVQLLLHGVEMIFPSWNIQSIKKFQTKFGAYFTKWYIPYINVLCRRQFFKQSNKVHFTFM
jgi:hypothetical protein